MPYLIFKALHVIAMVAWFAGLFYIFRLFVYHLENWENREVCAVFEVMEKKLLKYIMLPAALATILFGLSLIYLNVNLITMAWLQLKLIFVVGLCLYHSYAVYVQKSLFRRRKVITSKKCRMVNEVPTIFLIGICFLVFLKPWA